MRLYLDTSLVVSALVREEASESVSDWLATRSAMRFVVSDWVVTELSAALSRKRMLRQISEQLQHEAQSIFDDLTASEFDVVPIVRSDFLVAAQLARRSTHGLRASDALHLAVAKSHTLTLCTRDVRLAAAGTELDCSTELLSG